jgi:hypothetical protein
MHVQVPFRLGHDRDEAVFSSSAGNDTASSAEMTLASFGDA